MREFRIAALDKLQCEFLPLTNGIDLSGQLDGLPGGGASDGAIFVSDPTGSTGVITDPSVNPNPSGGWMTVAAALIQSAGQAFTTYERGSPQVGTPAPLLRSPSSTNLSLPWSGSELLIMGVGVLAIIYILGR